MALHSHVVQVLFMTCLHVVQVLFMTHVAMRYFALFTPCTCMWNFVLSVGVCGTVELLFKDHLENKEKMRSYGSGEACDSFSWKCQGNFSIWKKKKKRCVGGLKRKDDFCLWGFIFTKVSWQSFRKERQSWKEGGLWFWALHGMSWEKFHQKKKKNGGWSMVPFHFW